MDMLALKNGSEEPKHLVIATMLSVERLWHGGVMGLCHVAELVNRCHEPNCCIDPSSERELKKLALLQEDGSVHPSVRNIMLSATTGRDLKLRLGSPY